MTIKHKKKNIKSSIVVNYNKNINELLLDFEKQKDIKDEKKIDMTLDTINYKYALIDIRYGFKLYNLYKNLKTPEVDDVLYYTPQYYIDMINMFLEKNKTNKIQTKIIIITDSLPIVKKFIINSNINSNKLYKDIILLESNWMNTLVLFCNASYIVMSYNTLSISASYINKNAQCYIVLYRNDPNKIIPEDKAIAPNWIISHNKNYILNYNKELILEMIS